MDKVNLKIPSLEFFKNMLISLGYPYLLLQSYLVMLHLSSEKVRPAPCSLSLQLTKSAVLLERRQSESGKRYGAAG